jgi:hypothetical protein
MLKKITLYSLVLLLLPLSGCSWVEYFTVNNLSDKAIHVSYKTRYLSEGKSFAIFDHTPTFYKATKKGNIDWDNKVEVEDTDESSESVSVTLPANTIMIFGRLHNDTYKSHDQEFINGRDFNLYFMEIEVNLELFNISKETFDKNFTKEKGQISYTIS